MFDNLADARAQLDDWVHSYNHDRPHQGIGKVSPWERFRLGAATPASVALEGATPDTTDTPPVVTRVVTGRGTISFASVSYKAGKWLAGEIIEVICDGRHVHLWHQGVLVATHARRQSRRRAPGFSSASPRPDRPLQRPDLQRRRRR